MHAMMMMMNLNEDGFASAFESDSETERKTREEGSSHDGVAVHVTDAHPAAAPQSCATPNGANASVCSGVWQRPKKRNVKRKTASITPDKVPKAKKLAPNDTSQ